MSSILQEGVSIQSHSLSLIWLGPIGKDHVHYHDKHTVLVWMNNVGSVLGQIDEVIVGVAGELKSIDQIIHADYITDVEVSRTLGCPRVEHLGHPTSLLL